MVNMCPDIAVVCLCMSFLLDRLDSMANQDDFPAAAAAAAPPPPPTPPQQQQPRGEAGGAMPPSERDWLLADKQQALQDELTAMNVTRQELINILKDLGQPAPENATQVWGCHVSLGGGGRH
jgi:hypothetical protein